jgi:hypothetical protein
MMSYGIGTNESGEVHVRIEVEGKELGFFFDDAEEARLFAERILTAAAQAHAIKKSRGGESLAMKRGE